MKSFLLFCLRYIKYSIVVLGLCCTNDKNSENKKLVIEYSILINKAKLLTNGKESLSYSIRAYSVALELGDNRRIANSCMELSHDYDKLGDINSSLQFALNAANLFENLNVENKLALSYNKIGSLYGKQGDIFNSLHYLEKALGIHIRLEDYNYITGDLINIGETYRLYGNAIKAKSYFFKAFNYLDVFKDRVMFAYNLGNIGLCFSALEQYDSANYYLEQSKDILNELGDNYPITVYMLEDARILYKNNEYYAAIKKVKESIALSENENFLDQMAAGYNLLSEIEAAANNYSGAYFANKQYHVLKDSLTNVDLVRKMESQRTDYEVSKREDVIQNLEQVNKLRITINLILGIGIILVAIFAVFFRRLNRKLKLVNAKLELNKHVLEQKNITIEGALVEKEALLKEIHHRVKNNLQIISSLLSLQSRQLDNKKAKDAIEDSHKRLQTISLIHQRLYQSESIAFINVSEYIQQLMEAIESAFRQEDKSIKHRLTVDDLSFDVDMAVPVGLIINELAINAYKYAFTDSRQGAIDISLKKTVDKNNFELVFKDNGIGLPKDYNPKEAKSLGLKLVNILSRQLGGELKYKSEEGAEFTLTFAEKEQA